jgi:hypothetical protein
VRSSGVALDPRPITPNGAHFCCTQRLRAAISSALAGLRAGGRPCGPCEAVLALKQRKRKRVFVFRSASALRFPRPWRACGRACRRSGTCLGWRENAPA